MATYQDRMDYINPTRKPESAFKPEKQIKSVGLAVLSTLKTFGQNLLVLLSQGSELRVWQTQDRSGVIWWNVYDPMTQQTARLLSEVDVRVWIEQRYHGNPDRR